MSGLVQECKRLENICKALFLFVWAMKSKIGLAHIGNGSLWKRSPQLGKVMHKPERQLEILLSERPSAIGLLNSIQRLLAVACMQLLCNLQIMCRMTIVEPAELSEMSQGAAMLQEHRHQECAQLFYSEERGVLWTVKFSL